MNLNTGALVTLTAAAAGTYISVDLPNGEWSKGSFLFNVSAKTGSPSAVVTINGKDPVSGEYYALLVSQAVTTTGQTLMQIAPGLGSSSNAADAILPATYQISVVITGSGTMTGTIAGSLLL